LERHRAIHTYGLRHLSGALRSSLDPASLRESGRPGQRLALATFGYYYGNAIRRRAAVAQPVEQRIRNSVAAVPSYPALSQQLLNYQYNWALESAPILVRY